MLIDPIKHVFTEWFFLIVVITNGTNRIPDTKHI